MTTATLDRPSPRSFSPPDRSLQQRMDALTRANAIRTQRAELKRNLKAGRSNPVDIISDPPEWAESMKIIDLLLAVPKFGQGKVGKLLRRCRVSPSKTLGGLSTRQRDEIVTTLGSMTPRKRRRSR